MARKQLELALKKKAWNKGKKLHNWGTVSTHRRRVNPAKRRRKAKRRSNPTTVLLANPQRRRRRVRKATRHVTRHVRSNPIRRRRRRGIASIMRSARVRRRANPFMPKLNLATAGTIFRMALFGGAGVMLARVAGTFYSRNIAKHVLGDAAGDPKSWRQIANEGMRLAFMAAATIAAERALRSVPARLVTPTDRQVFLAAGVAEAGRQAIGITLQRLKPGFDRGRVGLDGPGDADGILDANGNVWLDRGDGRYQLLSGVEDSESFAGVEDADSFAGIESAEAFAG